MHCSSLSTNDSPSTRANSWSHSRHVSAPPGCSPSGRPATSICSRPISIRIWSTSRPSPARTSRAAMTPGLKGHWRRTESMSCGSDMTVCYRVGGRCDRGNLAAPVAVRHAPGRRRCRRDNGSPPVYRIVENQSSSPCRTALPLLLRVPPLALRSAVAPTPEWAAWAGGGERRWAASAIMCRSFSRQSAALRPASRNRWLADQQIALGGNPPAVLRQQPLPHRLRQTRTGRHRPAEQRLGVDLVDVLSARPAAAGEREIKLPQRDLQIGGDDEHGMKAVASGCGYGR